MRMLRLECESVGRVPFVGGEGEEGGFPARGVAAVEAAHGPASPDLPGARVVETAGADRAGRFVEGVLPDGRVFGEDLCLEIMPEGSQIRPERGNFLEHDFFLPNRYFCLRLHASQSLDFV